MAKKMDYSQRLHKVIPAGCHTYSRGDNQFPGNAPQILADAHDAYVYDVNGQEFLDYGMGLRSVACGYAEPSICEAAVQALWKGNCLSRPSMLELEAAEMLTGLLGTDMVKFTKTGSATTTAAAKLARAATGRGYIAMVKAPFYSYDDWFIQSTNRYLGCLPENTVIFHDIQDFGLNVAVNCLHETDLACIITEPYGDLQALRQLCDKHGIILIFDEMITGFRYRLGSKTDVKPDLACYGKAIANGFSVAALTGKREIMKLGAHDDMFLLSTTHGAEMCGLAAMMATLKFMQGNNVIQHLWAYGKLFREMFEDCKKVYGFSNPEITGDDVNPSLKFDTAYNKTLFMQELCKQKVLMPWVAFSYAHKEKELEFTRTAIMNAFKAIDNGAKLEGPEIKPVFA